MSGDAHDRIVAAVVAEIDQWAIERKVVLPTQMYGSIGRALADVVELLSASLQEIAVESRFDRELLEHIFACSSKHALDEYRRMQIAASRKAAENLKPPHSIN